MKIKPYFLNPAFYRMLFAVLISGSILSGCGDSNSTADNNEQQSKLAISLTDAEGDFTHYTVDVTALKLYRANGVIIETLPNTTTLDFVQYIDVSEFLTTATVPVGIYTKAEITLDYTQAEIAVENENGLSIPATAQDDDGNPIQSITLTAQINSSEGFVIRAGQPAHLSIDFDLEASNAVTIDPLGETAIITVNPILVANTSIDDDKTRRVRGLLHGVDSLNETFEIDIRPFRTRHHSYGVISVNTDDQTMYEINGVSYNSEQGFEAMLSLEKLSPVVVLGKFNYTDRLFLATQVYAGNSVPWGDKDAVRGSIIARSGNTLTVLGATIELDNGHFTFNDEVSIQVDDLTKVNKQGSTESVDISDLSIGQRVLILGNMTDESNMDATDQGIVRMRYSDIAGKVISVSPLQLDLQHINRRNSLRYDFSGTGTDTASDADSAQYEINTGTLALDSLTSDAPVWVRGFPTPFGSAPEDFTAKTVIDFSLGLTQMFITYGDQGSSAAVVSLDENSLLLDIESAIGRHHLKQAGIITDISELPSVPVIHPADGRALYVISQGRSLDVYTNWLRFQLALTELLSTDRHVIFVHGKGLYEPNELSFNSRYLLVRLSE